MVFRVIRRLITLLILFPFAATSTSITLVVNETPPLAISEGRGFTGVSVSFVEEMFKRARINYEFHLQPTKRALRTTRADSLTCAFPIVRSQEREPNFSWVGPIAISRLGLYSRPGEKISLDTLYDAKDVPVVARLGSNISDYLRSRGFMAFTSVTPEQGFRMLMKNRVDLWAVDIRTAADVARVNGYELGKAEIEFYTSIYYLACNAELPGTMLKKLHLTLEDMYDSGWAEKALNLAL